MAFHLVLATCILIYLHGVTIVFATSDFNLYTDSACQDFHANVYTHTNAGDGSCGQTNGVYSASVSSLDSGCYLTIYSDICASNATAVRIGQCTTLQNTVEIASFSVDCPENNGVLDGYTTSLAAAAQTSSQSPTSLGSTTSSSEPQQVSTTPVESSLQEPLQDSATSTPSPSSSGSTSLSPEPQQVPTTSTQSYSSSSTSALPTPKFSSSSSKGLQQTSSPAIASSPASPLPTTASDLPSKSLPLSSSRARSSSSFSSPSETALNNDKGGGIGTVGVIIVGVLAPLVFIILVVSGVWFFLHRKRKQRQQESQPQSVVLPRANVDRPDLGAWLISSTAYSISRDLGSQPRRNSSAMSDQSGFSSMPTDAQGHPPFSSMG